MSIIEKTEEGLVEKLKSLTKKLLGIEEKILTFESVDTDNSGHINPKEFNALVEKMHKMDRNRQIGGLVGKIIDVAFLAALLFSR